MKYEYIHDKGVGLVNEDAWFASDNMFGVFDGATGLKKFVNSDGKTGGYLAANIAKETFLSSKGSLIESLELANENIATAMKNAAIDMTDKMKLWVTSLAIVEIDDNKMEWVQIGDCLILLINKDGSHRLLINDYDHDQETLLMWHALAQKGVKDIRKELNDQLIKKRRELGITYGALDGEQNVLKFMNAGVEDLANVEHILLFTDGLFVPKTDPREDDDFDTFTKIFAESGLLGIQEHVRSLEKTDPHIQKYPRFKMHDDIAAIAITL